MGAFEFVPKGGVRLRAGLRFNSESWGGACLVGASAGGVDPLKPMHRSDGTGSAKQAQAESVRWEAVKTVADVERLITSSSGPVLLDLYADWCISCKGGAICLPEPEVARQLARFTLLRADVTANDAQDKALLKQFGLFGPPSLVFFSEDGREIDEFRVQGEVSADRLEAHLAQVLAL